MAYQDLDTIQHPAGGLTEVAQWGGQVNDNFKYLAAFFQNIKSNYVFNGENTASTTYTNLTTAGPTVTLTTGANALVILNCWIAMNTPGACMMSYVVSGATTIAATDFLSVRSDSASITTGAMIAAVTTLTPGVNTFTAKYRAAAGTGSWWNRSITVIPMP